MNRDGFTLIELIGVIILITILSLIIIPIVEDKIKESEVLSYDSLVEVIENSAKIYAQNYSNEIPELKTNNVVIVEISTLVDKGLLERKTLYDNDNNNIIPLDSTVVIINIDLNLYAKYNDDTENNIKIFLKGPNSIKINKNSGYIEYGAYLADLYNLSVNELDSSNITSNINITTPGTYYVNYSYTNAKTIKRTVIVDNTSTSTDNVSPIISLNGSSLVTITKGSSYTDAGATATDNIDGNITSRIVVSGIVNTKQNGTYYIKYDVVDLNGNRANTVIRTVIVN